MKIKYVNISKEEYLRIIERLHSIELEETEAKTYLIPFLNKDPNDYFKSIQVFILELNRLNAIIDKQIHFEKKKLIASISVPICSYQEVNEGIDNLLNSYFLPVKDQAEVGVWLPNTISCFISFFLLDNFLQAISPLIDKKRTALNLLEWLKSLQLEKGTLLEKKKLYEDAYKHKNTIKKLTKKKKDF